MSRGEGIRVFGRSWLLPKMGGLMLGEVTAPDPTVKCRLLLSKPPVLLLENNFRMQGLIGKQSSFSTQKGSFSFSGFALWGHPTPLWFWTIILVDTYQEVRNSSDNYIYNWEAAVLTTRPPQHLYLQLVCRNELRKKWKRSIVLCFIFWQPTTGFLSCSGRIVPELSRCHHRSAELSSSLIAGLAGS